MKNYLVNITLPEEPNEEFISLIPLQRAHVNLLLLKGIITSYSLSADHVRLWTTLVANSEIEVMNVLNDFPMMKFMLVEIVELAFHNPALISLPAVSMN